MRKLRHVLRFAVDVDDWTAQVLRQTKKRCQIGCLEPDPRNSNILMERFGGTPQVVVKEAALSNARGTGAFAQGPAPNSGSGYLAKENTPEAIGVRTTTIDHIWPAARVRLQFGPLKWLYEKVASVWGYGGEKAWRGLALYGLDGLHQRVADSPVTDEHLSTALNARFLKAQRW